MVNKFEGDAALCVFGAPVSRETPPATRSEPRGPSPSACAAELPEVDFGIGVSAGLAVAGQHRAPSTASSTP